MRISLEGDGCEGILAGLNAMEKGIDEKAGYKALRAGGKILAQAMKDRIRRRSGQTADSIRVKRARRGREGLIGVVVGATGAFAHIGRLLETGYMRRGPHGITHVPAYPWARPAWDSSSGQVESEVYRVLKEEIAKELA